MIDAAPPPPIVRPVGGDVAALAGPAVITGAVDRRSAVVIRRVDPDGTRSVLARFRPPTPASRSVVLTVAASPTTWAAGVKWLEIEPGEGGGTIERRELVARGAVAGGGVRTLARCDDPGELDDELPVAVAGDDVAFSGSACPGAGGLRLGDAPPIAGSHPLLTERLLAFWSSNDELTVVDRATSARTTVAAPGASGAALSSDGVVAVTAPTDPACPTSCRMALFRVAGGALVRPGLARTPGGVPLPGSDPLVAGGGGRVLAQRSGGNGLTAVDLATGARSYAAALGFDADATVPLAVDATTATFSAPGCDGTLEVRTEPTRARQPLELARHPCPVRLLTRTARVRGRTIAVRLRCPRGCDTEFDFRFGTIPARLPAGGARTVRVRLDRVPRRAAVVRPAEYPGRERAPRLRLGPLRLVP